MCCQQHDHHYTQRYPVRSSRSLTESLPRDIYLESVTGVYLQGYVDVSSDSHKRQRAIANKKTWCTRDFPYLKLSGFILPHASYEDLSPVVGGSAPEMMTNIGTTHCGLYANISFEQLGEIVLPNATNFLCRNAAATSYQMLWKSNHGSAYFRVEETSRRRTDRKGRIGKSQEMQGKKVQTSGVTREIAEFIGTLVANAPVQLQGSISDWIKKEKQMPALTET